MMRSRLFSIARRGATASLLLRALCALLVLGSVVLGTGRARGSVALLLEMPYGGLGTFNPTGHAALYFDHICASSPLELRHCAPGELGVVISRYDGIGEFDWVAMPLIPYLYGVETAAEVPASIDQLSALRTRDLYRREHLQAVAPDTAEGGMPQGNWYELVGSAFDRTIYGFQVTTTPEQDESIINYFDDRPNVTRYEGAFRNCADFTRVVLNRLYPHAVRRNYVADFGLTTPKSAARGLVHYARKHPGLELQMFRVPQLAGTIPRSMSIQGVAGSLLTRYGVPMTILSPHVTAVVLVAYVGKGRFAVPKNAPVLDLHELEWSTHESSKSVMARADVGLAGLPLGGERMIGPEHEEPDASSVEWSPAALLANPGCEQCDALPFLP